MISFRQTLWLIIVLMSLTLSGWYFGSSKTHVHMDAEILSHSIDFIVTDLKFNEFDAKGILVKRLETPKLHHIPFHNQFTLSEPHLAFQLQDPTPWQLSSQSATTDQGVDQINFHTHVVLSHPPDTTLYTESLTYMPHKQQVLSTQPVLLKQAEQELTADRMRIKLDTKRVTLRNAHAVIQAASPKATKTPKVLGSGLGTKKKSNTL